MSLKVNEWGFSNPVYSPLYPAPPLYWVDFQVQMILYETNIANIEKLLPYPLEPNGNQVITWISDEPFTNQGSAQEAAIYVQARYKDFVGVYEPFLYVSTEIPLAGGREIWGYCKKLANISLHFEKEQVRGEVERVRTKIMKCLCIREVPAKLDELPFGPVFSVKVIPGAAEDEPPLRQLVLTEGKLTAKEGMFFKGKGSVDYEKSEIDPTYILEPERVIAGYYGVLSMVLPYGKIIYRYEDV